MGSEAWANARRVSELLRDEYQAAEPEEITVSDPPDDLVV